MPLRIAAPALLLVAACATDGEGPAAGGGSGGGAGELIVGAGGSGGVDGCPAAQGEGGTVGACAAAVQVGAGEEVFRRVRPCGQVDEIVIPVPGSQPAPGHVWTSLLVRGFPGGSTLGVDFQVFLEDGTLYGENRICVQLDRQPVRAGWSVITGQRAEFELDRTPRTDLPGRKLTVRASVQDGARIEGAVCERDPPTCRVTGAMVIDPVLPPE